MSAGSHWAQRMIQALPPGAKHWAGSRLPGLRQWLGSRAYNRIDRRALRAFARMHAAGGAAGEASARSLADGLAVIVPCYNHGRFLEAALASLFAQTLRPFHIVCVDDCSTDDTAARLQHAAARLPAGIRMTVLQTPVNMGQAAAINWGVERTGASVYTVLNDDDYLLHDALDATWAILQERPELALLGAAARTWSGEGSPDGGEAQKRIAPDKANFSTIPLRITSPAEVAQFTDPNQLNMTHSGMTFYRSAWQAVGGYYPDKRRRVVIFTDRDFQLRVAAVFPVAVAQQTPFAFWRNGSSVDSGVYS